eukprot:6786509-Prymnesium_polylepis.1
MHPPSRSCSRLPTAWARHTCGRTDCAAVRRRCPAPQDAAPSGREVQARSGLERCVGCYQTGIG